MECSTDGRGLIGGHVERERGRKAPFFMPWHNENAAIGIMKLSPEQERERLARWLRNGEKWDPRNDEDYDTFDYGTEPLPGDTTWTKKKAP